GGVLGRHGHDGMQRGGCGRLDRRTQGGGKTLVNRVIAVEGDTNLLEVIGALRSRRGGANLLHGGNQQGEQYRDDGDNDKKLDEREGSPIAVYLHNACP